MPRIKNKLTTKSKILQNQHKIALIASFCLISICLSFAILASKETQEKSQPIIHTPINHQTIIYKTKTSTPEIPKYVSTPLKSFDDEFDKGISNYWAYFVALGEKNNVDISAQGNHIRFTITDYDTYAYLIYELQNYKDVKINTTVTNQGSNNNNAGLICRFNKEGWYEANISSSGIFSIYLFNNNEYRQIWTGGSQTIKINQNTNYYGFECRDNELILYINDEKIWSGQDNTFSTGKIGLSASTKNYQPIKIDFENISVINIK